MKKLSSKRELKAIFTEENNLANVLRKRTLHVADVNGDDGLPAAIADHDRKAAAAFEEFSNFEAVEKLENLHHAVN